MSNPSSARTEGPPPPERRTQPPVPITKASLRSRLAPYWASFRFDDIVTARHHSDDFIETRAEYIALRLRFMAFFFAVAVPMWIPIDCMTLRPEHALPIAIGRFVLSGSLLVVALLTMRKLNGRETHALLGLTIFLPTLFYFVAMLILNSPVAETPLVGYAFMPFVMIALLGLFPLTLGFGILMHVMVLTAQFALAAALGKLISLDTFDKLWVFAMFSGVSLWIQVGQLLMLLKLYRESTQDPLTGLINRRVMMKRLATEIAHNSDARQPFCVLMFDLDRFKRINDNYGHLTGDKVLRTTAQILQAGLRDQDIIARFGGEEFVAVLPNVNSRQAIEVAERIRQCCYDTQVRAPSGEAIQLSTSVGVTEYETGEPIEATLARVDECLYKAKEQGRNRVIHAQSEPA